MKKISLITVILLGHLCLFAQNQEIADPDKRIEWWGDIDGFLNQQAKVTLDLADEVLKANPPNRKEPKVRKMALLLIDNVLHEEKAAFRPAVQTFLKKRISDAVSEIRSAEVKKGAIIWKLYNHAFVVKTPSVTIGFDIQRGLPNVEGFTLSQELIQPLIDAVDVLFISHIHNDHADELVAELFLAQNKPVVTPPDLWPDSPIYAKIIHPQRNADLIQQIRLPSKGISLKTVTCPGHQGDKILNNVYLVFSPEGMVFSHTGDQSNLDDFTWIDQIGDRYTVDVVMTNSWSVYPGLRLANGFRPKLIIPGHENEMGHTIDHREPFWLNYQRLGDSVSFPWVQMAWGEKFHYFPNHLRK